MDSRIEEVAKYIFEKHKPATWNRWEEYDNEFIKDAYREEARQICQLFPQPLDDKELREQIAKIIGSNIHYEWRTKNHGYLEIRIYDVVDQILALLQLKIEEAEMRGHTSVGYELGFGEGETFGRRQERERMITLGNESCPHAKIFTTKIGVPYSTKYKRECSECWQALKGGE